MFLNKYTRFLLNSTRLAELFLLLEIYNYYER